MTDISEKKTLKCGNNNSRVENEGQNNLALQQKMIMQNTSSKDYLKGILQYLDAEVWVSDFHMKQIYIDPCSKPLFGYSISERPKIPIEEILTPQSLFKAKNLIDTYRGLINEGLKFEMPVVEQFEARNKGGSVIWIEIKADILYDDDGEPIGIKGITRDISSLKQRETELENAKQRAEKEKEHTKTLALLSKVIIQPDLSMKHIADIVYDQAIKITNSNFGYVSSIDRKTGDNIGHTLSDLLKGLCSMSDKDICFPKGHEGYSGLWGYVLNTGKAFYTNSPLKHPSSKGIPKGHLPIFNFLSVPAVFKGELVGQIALANKQEGYNDQDLEFINKLANIYSIAIYRKNTEDELKEARLKAEESDKIKTAFLTNISHEIRTPLNGILGFSGMLLRDGLSKASKDRYYSIVRKSSKTLLKIIDDILDISQIDSGVILIEDKPFDINSILHDIYSLYSTTIIEKEKKVIEIVLQKKQGSYILNSDEYRIRQILINLLDNAIKFTTAGKIEFGLSSISDNMPLFFVKDTGIGISDDKKDIIFDRFRQADEEVSRSYGGNGLGLSIVKSLVELLGGKIWYESEVGKGTTFWFTVQNKNTLTSSMDNKNILNEIDMKEPGDQKNGLKILLVEDDLTSRLFIEEILQSTQFDVKIATTGQETLKMVRKHPFDLVLLDIQLPDMNGLSMIDEIKAIQKNIYIIAQTAYAMQSDEKLALESGCDDYLSKPIDEALLHEKLRSFMAKGG
ncbi:MAG: response regulator [Bacteroidales bacterium]|nr:response regulator [Bacteroidales bacterium]